MQLSEECQVLLLLPDSEVCFNMKVVGNHRSLKLWTSSYSHPHLQVLFLKTNVL